MFSTIEVDARIKAKGEDLFDAPKWITVNGFGDEDHKKLREEIESALNRRQPIVPLLIESYGGSVYGLLAMQELIRSCPVPVATLVTGRAMSAGAFLLASGTAGHRYAGQGARIMIHEVSSWIIGKNVELQSDAKETDFLNTNILQRLATRCGKLDRYFIDRIHERGHADWHMGAGEALSHGLIDHVGTPTLRTIVKVHTSFEIRQPEA